MKPQTPFRIHFFKFKNWSNLTKSKRRRGLICRFLELFFPLEHLLHTYFGSKEKEEEQKQPKNIIEGLVVVVVLLLLLTRRALRLLFFGVSGYRRN